MPKDSGFYIDIHIVIKCVTFPHAISPPPSLENQELGKFECILIE